MEIMQILIHQIAIMFLFMAAGYVLYRMKLLTKEGSKELGVILLYLILPCAILKAYSSEFTTEKAAGLAISFVAALFALILSMLVSQAVFRRNYRIENFGAAFSNAGFIGIPLVQAVLGTEAVFYVSSFVALLNIFQWTYGVMVLTDRKDSIRFKKIRTNPIVLSMLIGLVLFLLRIPLPEILLNPIGQIGGMNAPVAMLILGSYLAQVSFKELFTDRVVYASALVRLILIPILTLICLSFIPASYLDVKLAVMIAASTPVGTNVAIFAQLNHLSYTQAVKSVCLSTLLCIATLPCVIGLCYVIWL